MGSVVAQRIAVSVHAPILAVQLHNQFFHRQASAHRLALVAHIDFYIFRKLIQQQVALVTQFQARAAVNITFANGVVQCLNFLQNTIDGVYILLKGLQCILSDRFQFAGIGVEQRNQ